jgi:flavin reductase (DIM6/NTAB) family NADH-FMN oxidoreductase RutF
MGSSTSLLLTSMQNLAQVKLAKDLGATHGEEVDKFKKFAIETEKATMGKAPILKGSFASVVCNVITSFPVSTYTVYLVEAVDLKVNKSLTPLAWHLNRYYSIKDEVK